MGTTSSTQKKLQIPHDLSCSSVKDFDIIMLSFVLLREILIMKFGCLG
jgi:hypothetical protein